MPIFYDIGQTSNVRKSTETFSSLQGYNLSNTSFLKVFGILKDVSVQTSTNEFESQYFFNIWKTIEFNYNIFDNPNNYTTYIKDSNISWDYIAYLYYGDRKLVWLLYIANKIFNPYEADDFYGEIKIPSISYVDQLIREMNSISKL